MKGLEISSEIENYLCKEDMKNEHPSDPLPHNEINENIPNGHPVEDINRNDENEDVVKKPVLTPQGN